MKGLINTKGIMPTGHLDKIKTMAEMIETHTNMTHYKITGAAPEEMSP
jgi:hypothetical protein